MSIKSRVLELIGAANAASIRELGLDAHPPVDLKDGRQLVEQNGKAHIKQGTVVVFAPDATYATKDGKTVKVAQGRILQDDSAAPVAAAAPTAPVEQNEAVAQAPGEWPFAGSTLRIEATDMGEIATVIAADGTASLAPAGEHTMDDGTVIVVGEGGMVMEIRAAEPTAQAAETPPEQPVSQEAVLQSKIKDLEKTVAEQQKQLVKLGKLPATTAPPNKVAGPAYDPARIQQGYYLGNLADDERRAAGLYTRDEVRRNPIIQRKLKEQMRNEWAKTLGRHKSQKDRIKIVQEFVSSADYDGKDNTSILLLNMLQQSVLTRPENRYVSFLTDVKSSMKVPRLDFSTSITQAHSCDPQPQGLTTGSEVEFTVCDLQVLVEYCIRDFDATWAELFNSPGFNRFGSDIFPPTLGDAILAQIMGQASLEQEDIFINGDTETYLTGHLSLCDGIIKKLNASDDSVKVDISAFTEGNIISQFKDIRTEISTNTPLARAGRQNIKWFMSHGTLSLYEDAMASSSGNANYNVSEQQPVTFHGYELVPVDKMPDDVVIATFIRGSNLAGPNLVLATDLESDMNDISVEALGFPKSQNVGIMINWRQGAGVYYPEHSIIARIPA